jgi:hypothetical protein
MLAAHSAYHNGRMLVTALEEASRYQREVHAVQQLRRIERYQPVEFPITLGWRAPFFVVAPAVRWQMTLMTRGVDAVEVHDPNYSSYTTYLAAENAVGATCMFVVRPGGERTTLLNVAVFWPCAPGAGAPFTIDGDRRDASTMNPLFGTLLRIDRAVIEAVQSERADSEEAIRVKPRLPRYTCTDDWPAIFAWVDFFEPRMTNGALAELLGVAEKTVANARNAHKWPQIGPKGENREKSG